MIFGFVFSTMFGGWILFAHFVQRNLTIYTSDRYYTLILAAGFAALAFGIAGLILNRKKLSESDSYSLTFFLTIIGGLLFSPILLIFSIFLLLAPQFKFNLNLNMLFIAVILTSVIFPTKGISSALAEDRADEINTVNVQTGAQIVNNFATSTDKYSIGDWIASMSYNPDPQFYKGKTLSVDGFIFRSSSMDDTQFYVARYTIRCCVADAAPSGLKVNFELGEEYAVGDWVNIKGKFDIDNSQGFDEVVIIPDEIVEIPVPEKQYIF